MRTSYIVALIAFSTITFTSMGKSFEVLPISKLNELIENKKNLFDTTFIQDYNQIFVYKFKDGTSILMPPVLAGEEGIYFTNNEEMEKMISSRVFPVKGNGTYFELRKEEIYNINSDAKRLINELSTMINFDLSRYMDRENLPISSDAINKAIAKFNKKQKDKFYSLVGIYIGEILKRSDGAEWKLRKVYAFNTYFIPDLYRDGKPYSFWNSVHYRLEQSKFIPFDIGQVIEDIHTYTAIKHS